MPYKFTHFLCDSNTAFYLHHQGFRGGGPIAHLSRSLLAENRSQAPSPTSVTFDRHPFQTLWVLGGAVGPWPPCCWVCDPLSPSTFCPSTGGTETLVAVRTWLPFGSVRPMKKAQICFLCVLSRGHCPPRSYLCFALCPRRCLPLQRGTKGWPLEESALCSRPSGDPKLETRRPGG